MKKAISNVVSIRDFDRGGILQVLKAAAEMDKKRHARLLQSYVLGIMFVEPSTRTRLSFASAMMRLGGQVLDFGEPERSSFKKGETLTDAIRMVAGYCDVIVMRHSWEGAARLAAEIAGVPIINGGDGANQHPTQTFLDLYTIQQTHGRIDGLSVGFLGDLRYSRTVHSLAGALSHFDCRQYFISPEMLRAPHHLMVELNERKVEHKEFRDPSAILPELDVLYCTRIQEERFADRLEFEQVKNSYRVDRAMLEGSGVKKSLRIMHPLPRVDELARDVDDTPYAVYFQQARNGIPVRQALLAMVLGKV